MPGGRILIVDDEPMVRETVGLALRREGYQVAISTNGIDALECVEQTPPDAIILDMMMPGMNGRQFIDEMRNTLGLTNIPILVMTAISGVGMHQAFALDAADVIEKPFDIEELLNKVALAIFRARREYPHSPSMPSGDTATPVASLGDRGVILIVDQDRAVSRHIDLLLGAHGCTVVSMTRISEDLPRLARVLDPQTIWIDHHLPEDNALAAVRALRAEAALDCTPIMLVVRNQETQNTIRHISNELSVAVRVRPVSDGDLISFIANPPVDSRRK